MGRTALLFAGQGAQFVGMGADVARDSPAAAEVYRAADRALGIELARLCFEGPATELDSTENAQPAVLATDLACLAAIEERGALPEPAAAAGLSLGEYAAHVAAGSLGLEEALRLVRRRGELMQAASRENPGTMASVLGLSRELVEEACRRASARGLVRPANFNSPGQVVISGEAEAVEAAGEAAKELGAKRVVPLRVSGAFHSPLMQPAAAGLGEALDGVRFRPGRYPVIANVTGRPSGGPDEAKRALLDQLTGAVLFEDTILRLAEDGVTRFVELGPGKVLSGLVRRTVKGAEVVPVGTAEAVAALDA